MKQKKTIKNEGITFKYVPFISFSLLAKVAICVIFSFSITVATAQKVSAPPPPPPPVDEFDPTLGKDSKGQPVSVVVDEIPQFIGGIKAMFKFLMDNVKYPENAREQPIEGTVYVAFIVEINGTLTDIMVKRGLGGFINEEAIRVVELMSGKWQAGKDKGKPVRSVYTLPVKFRYE